MVEQSGHKLVLTFLLSCGVSITAVSAKEKMHKIDLNNRIKECHRIKKQDILIKNNVLLLNADVSSLKSAGYCGCKSAVLSYAVYREIGAKREQLEYGKFLSFHTGPYTFVIDRNLNKQKTAQHYSLNIQCASPD